MRGMKRLTFANKSLMQTLDKLADSVADELEDAGKQAVEVIEAHKQHAANVKRTAAEAKAALSEFTNDPTDGSEAPEDSQQA